MIIKKRILIDGKQIKTPSVFKWGLQDISSEDAGRTEDNIMHKNRVAQKRKLQLSWNNPTDRETSAILQAFNPETFLITYPDSMSGNEETRRFYAGDRDAPVLSWVLGHHGIVSFNVIEV